jgi:hypothetical protein
MADEKSVAGYTFISAWNKPIKNNIEGEKSKNSNLEVRIWRDKKKLAIIILIIFFFIGLF